MNENENELERVERQIEISIEQARDSVNRKNMMDKIIQNREFNELFTIGYLEKEPARLTSLLADSDWQTAEKQKEILDDLRAISGLRQYIMNIKAIGMQMENQISRSQQELEGLRDEAEGE